MNPDNKLSRLKKQMYSRMKQPKQRPRRDLSPLERTTQDNWQEEAVEVKETFYEPDVVKKHSLPTIFLLISIVVFIAAGGIATYFFLSGSNVITSRKIDLVVNGPRTVNGGEILELKVSVINRNNATLDLADLVITYPKGTRSPQDLTTTMEVQRIPLGSIEPGGTKTGIVRGALFGRNGETQEINIALEYRLNGSNALFFTEKIYSVLVASGTLEISLESNTQAVAGQNMYLTATVRSLARIKVSDVILRASYPFGFTVGKTTPEVSSNGLWELGDLEPGETRSIRIQGLLDGQTGDTRVFKFLAGTRTSPKSTKIDVVLADFEHELSIIRPFLEMSLSYDGIPGSDYTARAGKAIPVILSWRNNLGVPLNDVVVAATLSGSAFDPFNVNVTSGFYRSIDSVIWWDKTTAGDILENIPAGATGSLLVRLIPKSKNSLVGVTNPVINIELHASGKRLAESSVPETIQATVKEEIKIATDVGFLSAALYFENPLGSVGPLPPKVENETTYGILWELSNSTNNIENTSVTAFLPPYMRWGGVSSPSSEHITYNKSTKEITWNVGKLLSNTGVGTRASRRVVFSVSLVPSTSQVGETPILIQSQRLVGTDTFTDTPVGETYRDLTTTLHESRFVDFYGVVVR